MTWHMSEDELRAYAASELPPPWLWSVDTHLTRCAECRTALLAFTDPAETEAGWARLDAELDAPRGGRVESLLVRVGVPDHTARLLVATPVLRASWLVAVIVTLLLGVVVGRTTTPTLLLATAPLLPLAGVAISFGPVLDPTHEMTVVAPLHTFRLLMVRTAAVLATTVPAAVVASLAMPTSRVVMAAWPLPALALTSLGLSLMPRLGPIAAPVLVGCGWVAMLPLCRPLTDGRLLPLTGVGQLAAVVVALAATVTLVAGRDRFDGGRRDVSLRRAARRLS